MPGHFKDLIEKINQSNDDDQISCIIVNTTVGWALEVAQKMRIKRAAVWPAGPGDLAFVLHIPKLIQDGIIDTKVNYYVKQCNWLLCNSFYELDSPACDLIPGIIPVAPLLLGNQSGSHAGSFWPQDSICLSWLDEQPMGSVIYVAFGSTATFSQQQFDEIALGLELIGQPFLWVVRSGITDGPPAEFLHVFRSRTNNRGMVVDWAPQEKVLDHLILHVL
nr:udp-glycosyltransferase 83a1 [Quercus suber]